MASICDFCSAHNIGANEGRSREDRGGLDEARFHRGRSVGFALVNMQPSLQLCGGPNHPLAIETVESPAITGESVSEKVGIDGVLIFWTSCTPQRYFR